MRKYHPATVLVIIMVIISICFSACSKDGNIQQTFAITDSLVFECLYPAFSQYENGKYYTSDQFDRAIKIYEKGKLLTSFGGQGEGPGEFENFPVLSVTDEYIVATEFSVNRFSVFSKEGKFLYSNPIDSDAIVVAIISLYYLDKKIIAYGLSLSSEGELGEYVGEMSLDGKLTKLKERKHFDSNPLLTPVLFTIMKNQIVFYQDNSLYFSNMDKTYSLDAIPTKMISAEFKEFMKTREEYNSNESIPLHFPKYKQSFELDNHIFIQSQYQYYQYVMKGINLVYELNLESEKLIEVELPVQLDLSRWFNTSGNKFIVLDEDEEQIREYEVERNK